MSENIKSVLVDKAELQLTFLVKDGDARLDIRTDGTHDLANLDDVIVFLNQDHVPITSHGPDHATANIGPWSRYSDAPVSLMVRVGEFFDGWDFEP